MAGKIKKLTVVDKKTSTEILTRDQVIHVAKLANLNLSEEEITRFQYQLSEVLTYVSQLKTVNTSNIKETSQVTGLENVFQTGASQTLPIKDALQNAPSQQKNMFQVKAILKAK